MREVPQLAAPAGANRSSVTGKDPLAAGTVGAKCCGTFETMRKRDVSLLDKIEHAGLSRGESVADALRAVIALGGRAGSTELRDWADRELRDYAGEAELPEYRRVPAPLRIDAVQGNQFVGGSIITGQRISPRQLPDVVADSITEEVEMRMSIGEIEELTQRDQDSVRLSPPMSADIVDLMNHEMDQPLTAISDLYWSVSRSALIGIVDQVRTTLIGLVAEIRAGLPDDADIPSRALADQAVQVVVHGHRNRVVTTASHAAHGGESSAASGDDVTASAFKRAAWWIVGAATVAAAIFAGWQVFGG